MLDLIKIAIILVTAPLWVPFAKLMWRELQDLFEEDGGLFGDDPGPLRRAAIRARRASQPSVLVHEWLAHVRSDSRRGVMAPGQTNQGAQATGRVGRTPRRGSPSGGPSSAGGPPRRAFR